MQIEIDNFQLGLHTDLDPRLLPLGAAQQADNVTVDRGDLRTREGRVAAIGAPAHLSVNVREIAEFYVADHTPTHRFVGIIATKIYWSVTQANATAWVADTATVQGKMIRPTAANGYVYEATTVAGDTKTAAVTEPTWPTTAGATVVDDQVTWTCRATDMWDEIDSTQSVHATNSVTLTQYDDDMYIVDGSAAAKYFTADGVFTTLTEFDAPTTEPDLSTVSSHYVLDRCNSSTVLAPTSVTTWAASTSYAVGAKVRPTTVNGYYYECIVAGTSGGSEPTWPTIFNRWKQDGTTLYWKTMPDGQGQYYKNASTTALSIGAWQENDTTQNKQKWYVRTDPDNPSSSDEVYSLLMQQTQGATDVNLFIVQGTTPGAAMNCGDVWTVRQHTVTYDLTEATAVRFSLNVDSGADTPFPSSLELLLGEESGTTTWTAFTVTQDEDGTLVSAMVSNTTYNFVVNISASAASLNKVRYVGLRYTNLSLSPNASGYARIRLMAAITANIGGSDFTPGKYTFTYTLWDGTEESAEYINADPDTGLENPYPIIVLNADLPHGITAICYRPVGSAATKAYLYAMGGASSVFKRVGEGTFVGDNTEIRTVEISWFGVYESDAEDIPRYIGKPPLGATDCIVYRNRMYYLATMPGDTGGITDVIHASNYGDPTRVPSMPTALMVSPVTYGGWFDPQKHGDNGVGVGVDGVFLYAFKRQDVFRIQGDPGLPSDHPDTFRITRLNTTDGCVSQRSICSVAGKLVWQGRDKLLGIGPGDMEPTELTTAIKPTVRAFTYTAVDETGQQNNAWSVYDPQAHRLYICYPSGSYGTSPNSTWLVLSLEKSAWTQWTAMPGACGLYSAYATSPGTYWADVYGTGGTGKVFRIDPTAVTDAINSGTAAVISPIWVSGDFALAPGRYGQLTNIRGRLLLADTSSAYTLATTLWLNNDDARTVTRNLTVTRLTGTGSSAQGTGLVDWTLAPHGEVESLAIKVARNDSNIVAIRSLALDILPGMPTRGRTVAA